MRLNEYMTLAIEKPEHILYVSIRNIFSPRSKNWRVWANGLMGKEHRPMCICHYFLRFSKSEQPL